MRIEDSDQTIGRTLAALAPVRRLYSFYFILTPALLLAVLLNLWMGEAEVARSITPRVVAQVLANHIPFLSGHIAPVGVSSADYIVWQSRLPRALGGLVIGALLALAGVAFQSLLMNPLADPYTVGVASGSALGSMAVILLGGSAWLGGGAPALAAFVCGLLAVGFVYLLARVGGRVSAQTFLLAGVVVGTFCWSLIPLIVTLSARAGLDKQIFDTLFGSLEPVGWTQLCPLLAIGLIGLFLLWRTVPDLDRMTQGEETATHLGVDVEAFKRRVIFIGTLMTAATVSVAGIIGFVGFVVPHIARRLVGSGHRALLPAAMLIGSLTLDLADWLSRVFLHNVQIGVVTSLFGVPVFCAMLRRRLVQN